MHSRNWLLEFNMIEFGATFFWSAKLDFILDLLGLSLAFFRSYISSGFLSGFSFG